ncbi:hypothetical protein R3P38DRAFT_2833215 [Favolaschia claudopus]|uniref:Secreted protein n=1 Tax=Favolaschia claudopus TaxID=2862362 RepID=A0AAW0ED76_9AGAR
MGVFVCFLSFYLVAGQPGSILSIPSNVVFTVLQQRFGFGSACSSRYTGSPYSTYKPGKYILTYSFPGLVIIHRTHTYNHHRSPTIYLALAAVQSYSTLRYPFILFTFPSMFLFHLIDILSPWLCVFCVV